MAAPLKTGESGAPGDTRVRETLQWLVKEEMGRGLAPRNDRGYVSCARSLLRMMWFLDFVGALLHNLLDLPPTESLASCGGKAYEVALAPHHPWLLRKTIASALMLLPSRQSFEK